MGRRKSLTQQARHDKFENPPCPKCGGASCVLGAVKLADERYSCHECDHEWPVHLEVVRKVTDEKQEEPEPQGVELLPGQKVVNPENLIDIPEPKPAEPEPEPEAEPTPAKYPLALSAAQAQLEGLYELFNGWFFGGKLPSNIVITIQTKGRKQATAWYARARWEGDEKKKQAEINFCAEHLKDGKEEICERMIHEMVHAQNDAEGIKDCGTSGRYHNKKFKKAAEAIGLLVEKSKACGHAHTELGPILKERVSQVTLRDFGLARLGREGKGKKESRMVKWTCGCRNFWAKTDMEEIKCEWCENTFAKGC